MMSEKRNTAYILAFANSTHGKGAQAKCTGLYLELLRNHKSASDARRCFRFTHGHEPTLHIRILAKVLAIGEYHSRLLYRSLTGS